MKTITLDSFHDYPELRQKITSISTFKNNDELVISIEKNGGGAIDMGDLLLNTLRSCEATIYLKISGGVASVASFVWLQIYVAKEHGYFTNITLTQVRSKELLMYHKPRVIKDGIISFTKDMPDNESLKVSTKLFDLCFYEFLECTRNRIEMLNSETRVVLNKEEASARYESNEDVILLIRNN